MVLNSLGLAATRGNKISQNSFALLMYSLTTSIRLITCFRHYDILGKTRSIVTTAITFSCENDAGFWREQYAVLRKSRIHSRPRHRI